MKRVLLYSGGMDSWLINAIEKPDVRLYIDAGSRYGRHEIKRLPADAVIEQLDLARWERTDLIIPLRNLYFVMVAAQYGDEIILGATAGDRTLDKSKAFARKASRILTYLYRKQHWTEARRIRVVVPYKDTTKTQLVGEFVAKGGDLEQAWRESFSCYHPDEQTGKPCWGCKACIRKWVAFVNNGFSPEATIRTAILKYAEQNASELRGRGAEGEEIAKALGEQR